MDLIIIRHARPEREEKAEGERADPPLSALGLRQAELLAEVLAEEHIDHLVASTMVRAHQTAMPLAERLGMDIELRDDLREADQHSNRYVPAEEMTPDDPMVKQWMDDPLTIFGEGYDIFRDRVVGGFDDVIDNNGGKTVAVFCHGMVTAVYLQVLWDLADPFKLQPDYASLTRVRASSKGFRTVKSVNEHVHMRELLA